MTQTGLTITEYQLSAVDSSEISTALCVHSSSEQSSLDKLSSEKNSFLQLVAETQQPENQLLENQLLENQKAENQVLGYSDSNFANQQDRAIIVHASFSSDKRLEDLVEFQLLAKSAKVDILEILTTSLNSPQAKYFVGQGKAEEIAQAVERLQADVVLVNHCLTPAQTRNLESLCHCRVVDRTGLILDIFAQRARSHEGKLQVELAQLKHLSTRLIRRKTGLDQQKGAVGLRGPGETQLETDRRLLKVRMTQLQKRLEKVEKQRSQNRQTRQKADIPTISLVGYTNAGKSTLFNSLTQADVYAADQLFATLDPTLRRLFIQDVGTVILADTVGFLRQLPHDLISAFKSTLQETTEADLLLHVIDCADSRQQENIQAVQEVLEEIQADQVPTLLVYNKIDRLENIEPHIEYNDQNKPVAVYLSAYTQQGTDLLVQAIQDCLRHHILKFSLELAPHLLPQSGKIRHLLYQLESVRTEQIGEQGEFLLQLEIAQVEWCKLLKQFPALLSQSPINPSESANF